MLIAVVDVLCELEKSVEVITEEQSHVWILKCIPNTSKNMTRLENKDK